MRINFDKVVLDAERSNSDLVLETSDGERITLVGQFSSGGIENFEDSSSHVGSFFVTFLADGESENGGVEELIVGGSGADTITTSGGFDYIYAGAGDDHVEITALFGAYVTPGSGNDVVVGSGSGYDEIRFLDHTLDATIAIDAGGSGTAVFADGETDVFSGGFFAVSGGQGNDTITATGTGWSWLEGSGGDDTLTGTGSYDSINFYTAPEAIDFTLGAGGDGVFASGGLLGTDTYFGIEGVVGSLFADTIVGNDEANDIYGYEGDDSVDGAGGNDVINGHKGDDVLLGGSGDDQMLGGYGDDTLLGGDGIDAMAGQDGNDRLEGGDGRDFIYGDGGDDTILGGAGNDSIYGGDDDDHAEGGDGDDVADMGAGQDSVSGGLGNDQLYGGDGDDTIEGGEGDDYLDGDNLGTPSLEGDDHLSGGDGNDRLRGGGGDDTMTGGEGDDRFFFADGFGHDTITDFELGDGILLSSVTGIDGPGDVTPLISQDGADALIVLDDDNSIRLIGIDADDLSVSPVAFVHLV